MRIGRSIKSVVAHVVHASRGDAHHIWTQAGRLPEHDLEARGEHLAVLALMYVGVQQCHQAGGRALVCVAWKRRHRKLTVDDLVAVSIVGSVIDRALRSLDRMAHRGRIVPELRYRGITAYRELIASPYRIVYRVMRKEAWALAVIDGRRDLDELLYERARRDAVGELE